MPPLSSGECSRILGHRFQERDIIPLPKTWSNLSTRNRNLPNQRKKYVSIFNRSQTGTEPGVSNLPEQEPPAVPAEGHAEPGLLRKAGRGGAGRGGARRPLLVLAAAAAACSQRQPSALPPWPRDGGENPTAQSSKVRWGAGWTDEASEKDSASCGKQDD